MFGMSLTQVYEAIHQGELPSVKIGRYYVPRAALESLLQNGEQRGAADRNIDRQTANRDGALRA
jgi:hypothetical protein